MGNGSNLRSPDQQIYSQDNASFEFDTSVTEICFDRPKKCGLSFQAQLVGARPGRGAQEPRPCKSPTIIGTVTAAGAVLTATA